MEWGRVTETERMPSLVGGNTELADGKSKNLNRFPNRTPNQGRAGCLHAKFRQVRQVRRVYLCKVSSPDDQCLVCPAAASHSNRLGDEHSYFLCQWGSLALAWL
jgi:hypothetical protein